MTLPARLTVTDSAYALDGGTTCLRATDEAGREHTVTLTQHAAPWAGAATGGVPGRLYFDGQLVPIRSEFEASVLDLLRSADVRCGEPPEHGERIELSPHVLVFGDDIRAVLTRGPEENVRALTAQVVEFVASDEYLSFADRVEQEADCTLYEVRVDWSPETFNRAVVAVKQVLGVGYREAREVVAQDRPVGRGLAATKVVTLAGRLRAAGLGVRVSPAFRWRLP